MGDFAHYLLIMSDFIIRTQAGHPHEHARIGCKLVPLYCLGIHVYDRCHRIRSSVFTLRQSGSSELPDIDIDIQKGRFGDFMKYVKEYMAEREGEGQRRADLQLRHARQPGYVPHDRGSAWMPKEEQDEIAKLLPQMIDSGMVDDENDVYEALKEDYPEIYEVATKVFDSVKNISQHACGWLFGTKDRPISTWVPLTLIASSGSLVTQYNMKTLEDMGLNKGDFLRLRTLDVIQNTRKLLGQDHSTSRTSP
jgi:DNA polymerase-3 subunit alpha